MIREGIWDVAIDDPRRPAFIRMSIKQSKTDLFRKGVDLCWSYGLPLSSSRVEARPFMFISGRFLVSKRK